MASGVLNAVGVEPKVKRRPVTVEREQAKATVQTVLKTGHLSAEISTPPAFAGFLGCPAEVNPCTLY